MSLFRVGRHTDDWLGHVHSKIVALELLPLVQILVDVPLDYRAVHVLAAFETWPDHQCDVGPIATPHQALQNVFALAVTVRRDDRRHASRRALLPYLDQHNGAVGDWLACWVMNESADLGARLEHDVDRLLRI